MVPLHSTNGSSGSQLKKTTGSMVQASSAMPSGSELVLLVPLVLSTGYSGSTGSYWLQWYPLRRSGCHLTGGFCLNSSGSRVMAGF